MKELFCSVFAFMHLATCGAADLSGNEYTLIQPSYKTEITLGFEGNRFYGQALNHYFGNYKVNGSKINFSDAASTKMAGPIDVMDEENKYLQSLNGEKTYKVDGDKLILVGKDGSKNVYKKK